MIQDSKVITVWILTEAVSGSLQTLLKFVSAGASRQSFNSQDTFLFTKRKKSVQAVKALWTQGTKFMSWAGQMYWRDNCYERRYSCERVLQNVMSLHLGKTQAILACPLLGTKATVKQFKSCVQRRNWSRHLPRKITLSWRGGEFKFVVLIKKEIFITKENRPASTESFENAL